LKVGFVAANFVKRALAGGLLLTFAAQACAAAMERLRPVAAGG